MTLSLVKRAGVRLKAPRAPVSDVVRFFGFFARERPKDRHGDGNASQEPKEIFNHRDRLHTRMEISRVAA